MWRIARTVSGRDKIATFSGDYHGIFDEVLYRPVTVNGEPRPLPRLVEWSAFRIVQEALTNVVKHTADACARVEVGYEPDTLALLVENNGRSVDGNANGGRGIVGMRERATVLGGEIEIGPDQHGGYTVRARIPVKQS